MAFRQDIVPEECKVTVKTSVIEIILKKASAEKWVSLEATQRKGERSWSTHHKQSQPCKPKILTESHGSHCSWS